METACSKNGVVKKVWWLEQGPVDQPCSHESNAKFCRGPYRKSSFVTENPYIQLKQVVYEFNNSGLKQPIKKKKKKINGF